MGFLDSVSSAINRGSAAASRTSRKAQLKIQLGDIAKKRGDLTSQLGASLVETVKATPSLLEGREALISGIEELDQQRYAIETELNQIESDAAAQKAANATLQCPNCGTTVTVSDSFCAGCGKPVSEIIQETGYVPEAAEPVAGGSFCPNCGSPVSDGDMFCQACGQKLGDAPAAPQQPEQPQQ